MSGLQWHILGGNNKHSIGMNSGLCTYEYEDENGKACKKAILFDAGQLIDNGKPEDPALKDCDIVFPDYAQFLYKKDDKKHKPETAIDGIFITHNHVDHAGALPLLILQGYKLPPIYATPYTARRFEQELSNAGLDPSEWPEIYAIAPGQAIEAGPLSVTPFWVSHSTPQSAGFFITSPGGTILHTGDFKMDPTVLWGPAFNPDQFKKVVSKPVDLLLLDSTGADKDEAMVSEQEVRDSIHDIIAQNPGKRLIVAVMSGYEENLASAAKVAADEKRTLWISGKAHEQTLAALRDTGMSFADHVGEVDIRLLNRNTKDDLTNAPPEQSIVVVTGTQGHSNSSLAMAAEGKSSFLKLDKDKDIIVFCAPSMPGQIGMREKFLSGLREKGFTVYTKNELPLYSPAHARLPEIIEMVKLVDPKNVLPVHGSAKLREACAEAMEKMGRKALRADNGDVIGVTRRSVKSIEPETKNSPVLIGLKTLQGVGKDGWKEPYYLQVKVPQKAAKADAAAISNKKHRPRIFNIG